MSRYLFGGSSDDYAVGSDGRPVTNRRVRFYTSAAMTTEITDVASDAAGTGSPLTVTTNTAGFWGPVYGPDAVTVMYAGAVDSVGNPPTYVVAVYAHYSSEVASFNGRTGPIVLTKVDVTGTGLAATDVGADAAGAAAAAQAASAQKSANLSDLASAATARTNLGLGSAATQPTTAFDAAGAAATVQTNLTAETTRAQNAEAAITNGLKNVQAAAAATTNQALTGLPTVDGVTLTAGQVILLAGQTAGSQNGLWTVAVGAWARPSNFAAGADATGTNCWVEAGTSYASSSWIVTGTTNNVIGTNVLTWQQVSGLGEVTAAAPLTKTGNTLGLASSAAAGTYTAANVTIDAYGRVTAAANGAYQPVYLVPAPSGDTTGATDTAAIQAKIDQAAAAGGGIVYVPANPTTSSWYWISQLQLKEYVTLCGAGIASRIKQIAGATTAQHMVVWADGTNSPHANVYDLLLDGNAANQTQTNIDVIHAARADSTPFRPGPDGITALARVQRVHINNYVQYGIYFNGSWHECRVKDNFLLYGGLEGIHFEGSDSEISDNTVGFVANRGINVAGPTNWLYGNKTWYVGFTVNVGGTGGTVNVDNTTYGDGLYIGPTATNALVTSHYSQDCARHAFAFDGVTGAHASGLLAAGAVKSGFWVNGATACTVVGKGTGTGGTGSIAIQTLTFAGTNARCYVRVTDSVGFAASNVSGSIDTKGNDVQVNMADAGTETIAYAATITPNPFLGRFKFVNALTGNITVNVPTVNCHAGQRLQFHFVQDGTGGRTITFAAGYKINWTPVTTANLRNVIEFIYNGSGAWIQVSGVVGIAA